MSQVSNRVEHIRSVKGMRDLLPRELYLWRHIEDEVHRIFGAYNFGEIRTPILEQTPLFARTVGADTDIVAKEMFTFDDHELPELVAEQRDILRQRIPLATPDFAWFNDRLEKFASQVEGAVQTRKAPRTPDNETALRELQAFLPSFAHAKDVAAFRLYFEHVQQLVRRIRLGDSLTLRPEATASVVRAYIEHSLYNEGRIQKLYYMGPMFRRERPQKGRFRQFYQIGAEVLGSDSPHVDAEVLEMLVVFLQRIGVGEFKLLINSVGCPNCRPEYLSTLRRALESVAAGMCVDCQRRAKTNPLRVLDCKVRSDQPIIANLPTIFDHLDLECRYHFETVTSELNQRGIDFQISPRLVRGLDYYTRTTFEITSGSVGAQDAILGGGRYDGLSEMLGGPPTPGIGFAIGQDRLVLAVSEYAKTVTAKQPAWMDLPLHAYIAWAGLEAGNPAQKLARKLRDKDLKVAIDYEPTKLKKSLGMASRLQSQFAIIIGDPEIRAGRYKVKDMVTGEQQEVELEHVVSYLKDKIKSRTHKFLRAPGLKQRCQHALSNALLREVGQDALDSKGYVRELEHNLVRGVSVSDFEEDFNQGAGDELRNKMKAPYSSSALLVNTFSRWRRHPSTLTLKGETQFRTLEFEKKCPTGLQGIPPHLDMIVENAQFAVAVEAKCTEYLEQKIRPANFSPSYDGIRDKRRRSPWFTHMLELINPSASMSSQYKWLDAAQLIKHYLGLSHEGSYQGRRVILLYLYWEPKNWQEFPEFHEHREEAARFGKRVSGDEHVTFEQMSYLDLWNDWRTLSIPDWLPDHVRAVEERYFVSVPK